MGLFRFIFLSRAGRAYRRPSAVIRRRALIDGVQGGNPFWRIVAVWIFGREGLKRFFGKHPEPISIERVAIGQVLKISAYAPLVGVSPRKYRRALTRVRAKAVADVEASRAAS